MIKTNNFKIIKFENINPEIKLPFLLCIPNTINEDCSLILNGITSDIRTTKIDKDGNELYGDGSYNDSIKEALNVGMNMYFSPIYKKLSLNYGNPILIPIIPRCMALYTGYLGYDVYHENFAKAIEGYQQGWSGFSEDDLEKFRNLDNQICYMINYSINYLETNGINVDDKVIATGYSASSKFVNYFSALHPDKVKMIIGGATGGLCIIPNLEYTYPLGFKDICKEKLDLFKDIPQFYYIGESDQNDPSKPALNSKKDENGNYTLRSGGYYSLEQTHIIHDEISSDVQKRFDINKNMYYLNGVNSVFKKYKGDHQIKDDTLEADIIEFYENNIKKNQKIGKKVY